MGGEAKDEMCNLIGYTNIYVHRPGVCNVKLTRSHPGFVDTKNFRRVIKTMRFLTLGDGVSLST